MDIDSLAREYSVENIIERELANGIAMGPFHRKWLIDRGAPERVRRHLKMASVRPDLVATKQPFRAPESAITRTGSPRAAINTTTTETNLWDPGIWFPIPAGSMDVGKKYTAEFGGVMGTTATPAISFRARCGTSNAAPPTGTDLGVGPTVTLGTFTAQPFYGVFSMHVIDLGKAASGTSVTGNGFVVMGAAAAATVTPHAVIGGALPTTVDDTIAQALAVSVIWGTNSGSNTITPQWMVPETTN